MKTHNNLLLVGLSLAALLNWTAKGLDIAWLELFSKPLLIPFLFLFLRRNAVSGQLRNGTLVGLFLSWVGDVLLLWEQEHALFFIGGLVAFLIAHLSYGSTFWRFARKNGALWLPQRPHVFLGLLALGLSAYGLLFPHLGELRIPVAFYVLAILSMSIAARMVMEQSHYALGGRFLFGGALLFMLSDILLAIDKFMGHFPLSGLLIMMTYVGAQTLLVFGVIYLKSTE